MPAVFHLVSGINMVGTAIINAGITPTLRTSSSNFLVVVPLTSKNFSITVPFCMRSYKNNIFNYTPNTTHCQEHFLPFLLFSGRGQKTAKNSL